MITSFTTIELNKELIKMKLTDLRLNMPKKSQLLDKIKNLSTPSSNITLENLLGPNTPLVKL